MGWNPGPGFLRKVDPSDWFTKFMVILAFLILIFFNYILFRNFFLTRRPNPNNFKVINFSEQGKQNQEYKFLFLSVDVQRKHVYVQAHGGEAVFWLEPEVVLAQSENLNPEEILRIKNSVQKNIREINNAWNKFTATPTSATAHIPK